MKKSVNQWCFPAGTPLDEIFQTAAAAGLDGVELNIYEPGGVGLTSDSTAADALAVRRRAESFGLELSSLCNSLLWKWPLSSPDEEVRTKGAGIVRKQLELAAAMGMDAVLVVPGIVDARTSYEQCWERSRAELSKLAPHAVSLGVKIGVENVWNKFLLSPLEMVRYIEQIGAPGVGAYFDVGNVLNFGFPEQWIRSLNRHIVKVHVKDFSLKVGNIHGFVPLLAGDVDWKAVRAALREVGYDDYITAELSPYASDTRRLIHDASAHMDIIMNLA